MPIAVVLRDGSKRIWIEAVTDDPTNQRWAFRFAQGVVGQENVDRLAEELHTAIAATFLRWQENEARIAQERPQVW